MNVRLLMLGISLFVFALPAFAQDQESNMEVEVSPGDVRGVDGAGKGDAFSAWGRYFGRDLPDPLDAEEMQEYQENKQDYDERGQAAAEFTDAAATVVTALPTGTAAANAASMVVSEGAEEIVEAETTDKPNIFARAWNGFKSFLSAINPFD